MCCVLCGGGVPSMSLGWCGSCVIVMCGMWCILSMLSAVPRGCRGAVGCGIRVRACGVVSGIVACGCRVVCYDTRRGSVQNPPCERFVFEIACGRCQLFETFYFTCQT